MDFQALSDSIGDANQLFERLGHQLADTGRWHELFEARLTEARHRLGLSLVDPPSLDDLPEAQRLTLENDYTAACREVGGLLIDAGRLREAWQYLRPVGDKQTLHGALSRAIPNDENVDELVELALYEAVDVERGFGWLLGRSGTCNAITTLEGLAPQLAPADLRCCTAALVRHLDRELRDNLANVIARQEDATALTEASLNELLEGRDWLFEGEAVHVDVSHLAAAVRLARVVTEPQVVELALGLTEYGGRLHESLQYEGDPPFEKMYEAHQLFFAATLDRDTDSASAYFCEQAKQSDPAQEGTAAIETWLVLLDRLGRPEEALAVYDRLVPDDARLSPYAPRMIDLALRSGNWELYEKVLSRRDDPVGLAMGLLARDENS
ncbi:MAG: hypothetical protein ACR2NU_09125 [Aeoliella sp.]